MNNSFSFSLKDIKNMIIQNSITGICKKTKSKVKNLFIYPKIIIMKKDLIKTCNLNTAIIEKEWIIRLKNDIFDGPKYLLPLVESISL